MTGFINIHAKHDPTALILQSAMQKINAMFAPYLGDGAIQQALESDIDMSPKATAERILSFASRLIGRVEADQHERPAEEQRSRQQLFNTIQTGIEHGFEQVGDILVDMQALKGDVKDTVNATYAAVQQGLFELAEALGLQASEHTDNA